MRTSLVVIALTSLLVPAVILTHANAQDAKRKKRGPAAEALSLGAQAPLVDVKMENIDGRKLSIREAAGKKGTLVMFSCNHCPWVVRWENRIAELGNSYPDRGIGWIVINSNDIEAYPADDLDAMKVRAKERGFRFPYVLDSTSEMASAFGASKTPECFLFDESMKLVFHGAIDDNAKDAEGVEKTYLKDAMEALIAGKKIKEPLSKALGCSIKLREGAAEAARKSAEASRETQKGETQKGETQKKTPPKAKPAEG